MKTLSSLLLTYLLLGLSLVGLSLGLDGCASSLNKKLDAEVAQENVVKTHSDLQKEADRMIEFSPGLTPVQRNKLSALKTSTRSQLDALYEQSLKLRSLMLKKLITTNYSDEEVELLESRIKEVENNRLSVIFSAVAQANAILGHNSVDNRDVMDSFLEGMGHGSRD